MDLTSICAANKAFKRLSDIATNSDHLGICIDSTNCVTFDYSSNQGFVDIAAAD